MANPDHLDILRQGVEAWNEWRRTNPDSRPDLSKADLVETALTGAELCDANLAKADLWRADLTEANLGIADLGGANLVGADLTDANLTEANLTRVDLTKATLVRADLSSADLTEAYLTRANLEGVNLTRANLEGANLVSANLTRADLTETGLHRADLIRANLTEANLDGANLTRADLSMADLSRSNLSEAILTGAQVIMTRLSDCDLTGSRVYGISVWDAVGQPREQRDLVVTPYGQAAVTVDDLEVAQFVYLMLNNEKFRNILDTITSKVVLILGGFTDERKPVLDAIRNELRSRDLIPVLFDFEGPACKDTTGTVETLARMARYIVADLTDPSSIPFELGTTVPLLRTTPVVMLRLAGTEGFSMAKDLEAYPWVIPVQEYPHPTDLINGIDAYVIEPAHEKLQLLRPDPGAASE